MNRDKSLIILDWDDTLFPTTWTMKNKFNITNNSIDSQTKKYFEKLDHLLVKLLSRMKKLGEVIIVTNALPEWIVASSTVLPKTRHILKSTKVISARKTFQDITNSATDWKMLAFTNIADSKTSDYNNIISVGDAEYEYHALINLYAHDCGKVLKAVKFVRYPSDEVLLDQLRVILKAIKQICHTPKHLDLVIKTQ
jgi:hypothetical protein